MSDLNFLSPSLIIISLSMLSIRAGAISLVLTGKCYEKTKRQALSAFAATASLRFTSREKSSITLYAEVLGLK